LQVPIAQYRNKLKTSDILDDLKTIKRYFNGKLIINDYIELIEFADGLHVGQEDLTAISSDFNIAIKSIRESIGNKRLLGLSTHNLSEIEVANSLDLDYIGLGAYRDTNTKDIKAIGGNKLLDIALKSTHKVALIGGVKLSDEFDIYPQIYYKVIGSDLLKSYIEN
jgi:thiamine-phosphate pyrophosphorylase